MHMLRVYARKYNLLELTDLALAIELVAMIDGNMNRKYAPLPPLVWALSYLVWLRKSADARHSLRRTRAIYTVVEHPPQRMA